MDSKADELPLSDRFWTWFEANKKPALIGLVIVILGILAAVIIGWQRSESETTASEAVANITADQAAFGAAASTNAAAEYLKIANEHPKTPAGARAVLLAAGSFFDQGKYDQAIVQFERFARDYPENPLMGQALLGVAASLEAQGKTNEATAAYKSLVERHPTDAVAPRAHFALGRLYEAQGKPEQARTEYETVIRSEQPYGGGGSMGNEAQIRLEEFRWKYPNLNPPAPPPAAMNPPVQLRTNPPQLKLPGTNPPQPAGDVSTTNTPQLKILPQSNAKPSTNK
jgi:predicted negative regulator of RcsB-dependent stress response